ncbi:MAG: hypothetical protein HN390_13790 [Anaerolineae bacterium]|jgi:hypothetical protein|nr:hypothetical protein [Anaerolineae bacterium]MBT7189732.1 hypothetical protein [Anaerolineae bacterium]MBT7601432.1 hypothetical protein [Anaerolineae bacterium]MBT7991107.1 hypothetical protein [Anaerolineae bacterium]
MKRIKTASILAFVIGAMAILVGARVAILNKGMPYYVLQGLPAYNLILGVLSVFPVTFLIWKKSQSAIPASIAILASHSIVLLILIVAYLGTVSVFSLGAMIFRIIIWSIILRLLFLHKKENSLENKGRTL